MSKTVVLLGAFAVGVVATTAVSICKKKYRQRATVPANDNREGLDIEVVEEDDCDIPCIDE